MTRSLCLLGFAILSLSALSAALLDCRDFWQDLCSEENLTSVSTASCSTCVPQLDSSSCKRDVVSFRGPECCSTAEAAFPPRTIHPRETCEKTNLFYTREQQSIVYDTSVTLPKGEYVLPYNAFDCSGCINEVAMRCSQFGEVQQMRLELVLWAVHDPPSEQKPLYKELKRVELTSTSFVNPLATSHDQIIYIFTVPNNILCFSGGETLGFKFSSDEIQVVLDDSNPSNHNLTTYSIIHPEHDETSNCSNLSNLLDDSVFTEIMPSKFPVIAVTVEPNRDIVPSTSVSGVSTVNAIPDSTRVAPSLTSTANSDPPQPTEIPPTDDPSVENPTSQRSSSTSNSLPIIVGIIGGVISILLLLLIILVAIFLFRRLHPKGDNVDGKKISRVRSRRLEQRFNPQPAATNPTADVGNGEDPFYDYPRPEPLHHYHQLEPPRELQVLQGSARGSGSNTPVDFNGPPPPPRGRTIYDDEVLAGMHHDMHTSKQIVHDMPTYQLLEQPMQVNGVMVAEAGYDTPSELLGTRSESKEEIHNSLYSILEPGPQQHMQILNPATTHAYHILEDHQNEKVEQSTEPEEVQQECGLYVPTAEERRQISTRQNTTDLSAGELENWIKKNRSETSTKRRFFEQSSTYWDPPNDAEKLYNTLSRRKYREILSEQLQIVKYIGHGQFGTVNLAKWTQEYVSPMDVAVKVCRSGVNESLKTKFLMEAAIMGQFNHKNVVKLYGVVTMSEQPMIVLELMKHGDLLTYLETNYEPGRCPPPSPLRLLAFCQQVAAGMKYLSNKSFVHRDLAARNILLNDMMQCKIGDFGMARDLMDSDYYIMSKKGPMPLKWTAPEALNYRKYSTFSDCYSYGMVLYEIWSLGRPPLSAIPIKDVPQKVTEGYCQAPPPGCPRTIYDMMVKLWDPKYRRRPPFSAIVDYLNRNDEELLAWSEEDKAVSSQAAQLGAPLEHGKDLYPTLQNSHQSSWC